jgi:hypothetical protein
MAGGPFLSRLSLAACIGLLAVPGVLAQSATGSISGFVLDGSGAALAGAAVTTVNTATGVARATTSASSGAFTLPLLPVGLYFVEAQVQGFSPRRIANATVAVGTDPPLKIPIQAASPNAPIPNRNKGSTGLPFHSAIARQTCTTVIKPKSAPVLIRYAFMHFNSS